jgi:hypothetical protein
MRVGVLRFYALKDGPLSVEEVKVVEVDGANVAAAICWIETDHPALGGRHRVVGYGFLAQETVAFAQAAGGEAVDATVDGWLRTNEEGVSVVADRVAFHVPTEVVERARCLLNRDG